MAVGDAADIEEMLVQLVKRVDAIDVPSAIEEHMATAHILSSDEINNLIEQHRDHSTVIEKVVTALDGEPELDFLGNVVGHQPGLMDIVKANRGMLELIDQRTNGGVTVTTKVNPNWIRNQKIAAAGVMTTLVFSALPGIVIAIRWIAHMIVNAGL